MEEILSIRGLGYTYSNGTRALNGVDLTVRRGERVAVLGSNGSGKSTLFLCLNGVLKAQQGEIRLEGEPLRYDQKHLKEVRRKVGIVFQDPETQLFCVDVFQEVAFGPHNLGLSKQEVARVVTENLTHMDLLSLRDRPPHFLSHGQKKRVSIAAVLAMDPQVLIFDEPTAALDPRHVREMMELLDQLSARGMTILMSTHDVEIACSWADSVVVMGQGSVLAAGTPEEIFTDNALLAQSDLCEPAAFRLFHRLVACGVLPQTLPLPRTMAQLERYLEERG